MGQTALIITVSYAIALVLGAAVALAVWRSTARRADGPDTVDTESYSRREGAWLVLVLALLFALLLATIFYIPYGAKAEGANKQTVNVTAYQYAWQLDRTKLRRGVPTEFLLQAGAFSEDGLAVNHGFGVYNDDHVLLFQAQVIPDQVQRVVYTFKKAGEYRILCLEYCGAGHHQMVGKFEVR